MEIVRYWNPLQTRVLLNDTEVGLFKKAVAEEHWRDLVWDLREDVRPGVLIDVIERRLIEITSPRGLQSRLDDIDHWAETLLDALINGTHNGNCVCIPMGCMKCYAESLIGIDTVPGLHRKWSYRLAGAVKDRRPDEAVQFLRSEGQAEAAAWLQTYYEEHFPDDC